MTEYICTECFACVPVDRVEVVDAKRVCDDCCEK